MLQKQALSLVESINFYIILGIIIVLPLFFLPITTDSLELPKQILFVTTTLVLLLLFGLKGVFQRKFSFRRTPFDLAVGIVFLVILISTLTSPSKSTSILAAIPMLAVLLFYFLFTNSSIDEQKERLMVSATLVSGSLVALSNILQFLKIYILPYPLAKTVGFSLTGSLLTSVLFLVCLLPIGLSFVRSHLKRGQDELWTGFFLGTTVLIIIGTGIGIYQLVATAKPLLLPQDTGLRTALQPLGLNFQTALFGTGPGTYLYNFTRFKDVALNTTNLWSVRFNSSSSFFLEILSTLGVIGVLSFLFLIFRLFSSFVKNSTHSNQSLGVLLSLVLLFLLSLFLPFSFLLVAFVFILLGFYAIRLANEKSHQIYTVTISIVALKEGLLSFERGDPTATHAPTDILPALLLGLFLLIDVLFFLPLVPQNMYNFVASDILFQQALIAANQNQGKQTYDLQNEAIRIFPNRAMYHRVFSQINLLIASSIVQQAQAAGANGQPRGLTDQDRQNVIQLAQQSINFGRNAVLLAPLDVTTWENLTGIYRSLIGFAQSADQFSIASAQQAISLDPVNPLPRITLGGLYYQLGQYDLAIQQFSQAINLKPDYANAYYNLGHAYEAKGDTTSLQTALAAYQQVRSLVEANSPDFQKIDAEIAALQKKLPGAAKETGTKAATPEQQEPLQVNTPSAVLPTQKPPVKVEGPPSPASGSSEQK